MPPCNPGCKKRVVIFFGMTASGKSFLAKAWARKHGFAYLNTDIIRKSLATQKSIPPLSEQKQINQGIYSSEFTQLTYDTILKSTREIIENDKKEIVVLDGSYMQQKHRDTLRLKLADICQCVFVLCYCSESTTQKRLLLRSKDQNAVSDGTWQVYLHQKEAFEVPTELTPAELIILETDDSLDNLMAQLEKSLL